MQQQLSLASYTPAPTVRPPAPGGRPWTPPLDYYMPDSGVQLLAAGVVVAVNQYTYAVKSNGKIYFFNNLKCFHGAQYGDTDIKVQVLYAKDETPMVFIKGHYETTFSYDDVGDVLKEGQHVFFAPMKPDELVSTPDGRTRCGRVHPLDVDTSASHKNKLLISYDLAEEGTKARQTFDGFALNIVPVSAKTMQQFKEMQAKLTQMQAEFAEMQAKRAELEAQAEAKSVQVAQGLGLGCVAVAAAGLWKLGVDACRQQ